KQPNRYQEAENAADAAVDRNRRNRESQGTGAGINRGRGRRSSQNRSGVEAHHPVGAVVVFKKAGQKPQRKQLKQGADQPRMNQAVRDWLPNFAMQKQMGIESKCVKKSGGHPWRRKMHQQKG